MDALSVTIKRFVDEVFSGLVECVLLDADDHTHRFLEKAPVVGTVSLSLDIAFPQSGYIAWLKRNGLMSEGGSWSALIPPNHGVSNRPLARRLLPSYALSLGAYRAVHFRL